LLAPVAPSSTHTRWSQPPTITSTPGVPSRSATSGVANTPSGMPSPAVALPIRSSVWCAHSNAPVAPSTAYTAPMSPGWPGRRMFGPSPAMSAPAPTTTSRSPSPSRSPTAGDEPTELVWYTMPVSGSGPGIAGGENAQRTLPSWFRHTSAAGRISFMPASSPLLVPTRISSKPSPSRSASAIEE